MSKPLYHEHLAFLREGGPILADAYPRVANMLAGIGHDPDVERLLEGIAYITSKINEKQDRGLDETCQLVFDLLFPHYLSPMPAATIVQLEGRPSHVPRGTEVTSVPVLGTRCRFQTTLDVTLSPLVVEDVHWRGRGERAQLLLELSAPTLELVDPFVLHLHGEALLTRTLFWLLLTRLESVELLDARGQVVGTLQRPHAAPLGFGEQEALLPYPPGSFAGFRLLQEYFALPQKFLFLSFEEIGALVARLPEAPDGPRRFGLRFNVRTDASAQPFTLTRQNLRLNCTPVVNLFEHSGDPLQRSPGRGDYQVRPAGPHLHYQLYRLLEVTGRSPHVPKVSYPLISSLDLRRPESPFCQVFRQVHGGETFTYVSLSDAGHPPSNQTLLFDLLCTNGELPRALKVGDIRAVERSSEERWTGGHVECQNIVPVTPPASPPSGQELHRRLIKHLAVSQRELTAVEALRDVVDLYDLHATGEGQDGRARALLLDGLRGLQSEITQCLHRGVPTWGQSNELTVEESAFGSEGELYLFGCVLNELYALQAPINFWSSFAVRGARSQTRYQWPRRLGRQQLQSS
jgi:type VI secretion system protein ImpG